MPTTRLPSVATSGASPAFLSAEILPDRFRVDLVAEEADQLDQPRHVRRFASRILGWGFGFGGVGGGGARFGFDFRLGFGRSPRGARPLSACASAEARRRRATRPSPWRRDCAGSSRPPRVLRRALVVHSEHRLAACSVRPTLPKRRLLGVRTRERTSLSPRLRAVSASSSRRGSLIACPARAARGRRGRRRSCR